MEQIPRPVWTKWNQSMMEEMCTFVTFFNKKLYNKQMPAAAVPVIEGFREMMKKNKMTLNKGFLKLHYEPPVIGVKANIDGAGEVDINNIFVRTSNRWYETMKEHPTFGPKLEDLRQKYRLLRTDDPLNEQMAAMAEFTKFEKQLMKYYNKELKSTYEAIKNSILIDQVI
jgi:hypothetical protein